MEEDDGDKDSMMMAKMAWGIAIVADFASWYVTDDKWSATNNTDWNNAINSLLGIGAFRAVTMAAGLAVPAVHDMFMPIAAISLLWEGANFYLINKAEGANASTTNSTTISYVCAGLGLLGSAKVTMASMKGGDDDDMGDDYADVDAYYEEPAPAEEEPATDDNTSGGYGGYGGYSYYGYYY